MKLELKHIAPYLPYELKVYQYINEEVYISDMVMEKGTVQSIGFYTSESIYDVLTSEDKKPVLRPLSDLNSIVKGDLTYRQLIAMKTNLWIDHTKDIDVDGRLDVEFAEYYEVISLLFKHHFDVFGLIEKGLAIDINTLN